MGWERRQGGVLANADGPIPVVPGRNDTHYGIHTHRERRRERERETEHFLFLSLSASSNEDLEVRATASLASAFEEENDCCRKGNEGKREGGREIQRSKSFLFASLSPFVNHIL